MSKEETEELRINLGIAKEMIIDLLLPFEDKDRKAILREVRKRLAEKRTDQSIRHPLFRDQYYQP